MIRLSVSALSLGMHRIDTVWFGARLVVTRAFSWLPELLSGKPFNGLMSDFFSNLKVYFFATLVQVLLEREQQSATPSDLL